MKATLPEPHCLFNAFLSQNKSSLVFFRWFRAQSCRDIREWPFNHLPLLTFTSFLHFCPTNVIIIIYMIALSIETVSGLYCLFMSYCDLRVHWKKFRECLGQPFIAGKEEKKIKGTSHVCPNHRCRNALRCSQATRTPIHTHRHLGQGGKRLAQWHLSKEKQKWKAK